MNNTGIIDYGAGNLFSLQCALDRIKASYIMVNNKEEFVRCDRFIIPGVGHAAKAMEKLNKTGLVEPLYATGKPVLGICLGMQLITSFSEEGSTDLLNIVDINTKKFENNALKIPHMGWNQVDIVRDSKLFNGVGDRENFYFVHSYCVEYNDDYTIGITEYGMKFSSAIRDKNFYGVQFHPEKSGIAGEKLLQNFINI